MPRGQTTSAEDTAVLIVLQFTGRFSPKSLSYLNQNSLSHMKTKGEPNADSVLTLLGQRSEFPGTFVTRSQAGGFSFLRQFPFVSPLLVRRTGSKATSVKPGAAWTPLQPPCCQSHELPTVTAGSKFKRPTQQGLRFEGSFVSRARRCPGAPRVPIPEPRGSRARSPGRVDTEALADLSLPCFVQ